MRVCLYTSYFHVSHTKIPKWNHNEPRSKRLIVVRVLLRKILDFWRIKVLKNYSYISLVPFVSCTFILVPKNKIHKKQVAVFYILCGGKFGIKFCFVFQISTDLLLPCVRAIERPCAITITCVFYKPQVWVLLVSCLLHIVAHFLYFTSLFNYAFRFTSNRTISLHFTWSCWCAQR